MALEDILTIKSEETKMLEEKKVGMGGNDSRASVPRKRGRTEYEGEKETGQFAVLSKGRKALEQHVEKRDEAVKLESKKQED